MASWLGTTVLAAAALALSGAAQIPAASAADYPAPGSTIHLLVGFSPGGGTDLAARLLASRLETELGTTVVVENHSGGGGLEAVNRLIAAEPDGYTLALVPLPASIMLYIDPERGGHFTADDVVPIAIHDYSVLTVATAADSQWQSMQQLLDAAKASPDSVSAASSGVLAMGHLGLLLLNQTAGVELNWTTFEQAGLMRSALLGHHIDVEISGVGEVAPAVAAGDVRLLAIYNDERLPDFPDVPTLKELGYDIDARSTRAVIAPKGTPQEIVDKLDDTIARIEQDPAYQAEAASRQVQLLYMDSDQAKAFWHQMEETYRPLVETFRASGG